MSSSVFLKRSLQLFFSCRTDCVAQTDMVFWKGNWRKKMEKRNEKKTVCPVFEKCGGCQLLDKSYDKQLRWKKDQVSALLQPYGKIDGIE